ncbi:MAG: GNAT family N-acetyltransferase [Bryobacteraceae bacterium]
MQTLCEESVITAARVPATHALRGALISRPAEFQALAAEWDDLFRRANPQNIFLSFGWMSTWWKHFGKGQLALIAVRQPDGRLVALAPFYIARAGSAAGMRRLGFLADQQVGSDYLSALCDPALEAAAAKELARVLVAFQHLWDYIELCDTPDSPFMAALSAELSSRGMRACAATHRVCRYIPLPERFEEYLAGIRSGLRANYRRRWRNLQREHGAECLVVSSIAELEKHFPSLIALHRMRFEQRAADSAFLAPGIPEFHADAMRVLAAQGFARLFVLQADGEPVAALYGFSVGGTFQFYQCGMHPGWAKYGLGQVLIGKAIEHAIGAGHTVFDFLRGGESYKAQWAGHAQENLTLRFFNRRAASIAARGSLGMAAAAHAAARVLKACLPGSSPARPAAPAARGLNRFGDSEQSDRSLTVTAQ